MKQQDNTALVIGAGAAGIIAAWRAASLGARVRLLEKNDRIGIKILISGGGKCNITHDGDMETLLRAFRSNEARFLRPACYRFTNRDVLQMLTARGLEVSTREDGRVFPAQGSAKDVVAILRGYLDEAGVRVDLKSPVTGLKAENGTIAGVMVGGNCVPAQRVIVAVGGSSYPGTGTTGDGFAWARDLGHSIVKVRSALAPVITNPAPPEGWAGVALRNCLLRALQEGKEIARWQGDLLFTHQGVSGPTVLGISRVVAERRECGSVQLHVDLCPEYTFETLTETVIQWTREFPRRHLTGFVAGVAPHRLIEPLLEAAQIAPNHIGANLSQKSRNRLVATLKGWPLGAARHVPLEKGEVVAGGVALNEVDPKTMESRIVRGLYLCGEILDIAGPVGGYNLQAAFSTGFVAGESAALDRVETRRRGDAEISESGKNLC